MVGDLGLTAARRYQVRRGATSDPGPVARAQVHSTLLPGSADKRYELLPMARKHQSTERLPGTVSRRLLVVTAAAVLAVAAALAAAAASPSPPADSPADAGTGREDLVPAGMTLPLARLLGFDHPDVSPPDITTGEHHDTYLASESPDAHNNDAVVFPDVEPRPWQDTTAGVHVFGDQLPSWMDVPLMQFVATHYAGTQKIPRSQADQLRALNPEFMILHYRLGIGLGAYAPQGGCLFTGETIRILEGNMWVQEWPGDAGVPAEWYFPYGGQSRVKMCTYGWYLMDVADPGYRNWWHGEALRQLNANDDDGLFLDSVSVPNYFGSVWSPALPAVDSAFESTWATKIHDWLAWLKSQPIGEKYVVVNVGQWVTTRDPTDYSPADGVMIEGWALWGDGSPFTLADWKLQMNRVLGITRAHKALIAQTYVHGARERGFALGSYLLTKTDKSYLTVEWGSDPEWFPEYDTPIGSALTEPPASIDDLDTDHDGVYRRDFANGFVLVNPSPTTTRQVALGGTHYVATYSGGGAVPANGVPTGTTTYSPASTANLAPYSAAVVFHASPLPDVPFPDDTAGPRL